MSSYGSSPLSGGPSENGASSMRPMMRRKSSANNLLSSFSKPSNPNNISPSPTPAPAYPLSPPPSNTMFNLSERYAPQSSRDWDAQSSHHGHDREPPMGPYPVNSTQPLVQVQPTSVEALRDTMQKRILTLTYMRNLHEGRSHWFHTILMTRPELDRVFNNTDMKKRTKRFAILGMSLSSLLEINSPLDMLRGLLNIMTEYDQAKEDTDKPKIRLFRAKTGVKRPGGMTEWSAPGEGADGSYLVSPHIPFPLDYHEVLLSLIDILSEVYAKISRMLGPSAMSSHLTTSPPSQHHMMGPLGLLTPEPGVSYLFADADSTERANPISLWSIAHAGGQQGIVSYGSSVGSPPGGWAHSLGDMVTKVDVKIKKITSALLKDLDDFARNSIKDELASLDPLLRNMTGRQHFDVEKAS